MYSMASEGRRQSTVLTVMIMFISGERSGPRRKYSLLQKVCHEENVHGGGGGGGGGVMSCRLWHTYTTSLQMYVPVPMSCRLWCIGTWCPYTHTLYHTYLTIYMYQCHVDCGVLVHGVPIHIPYHTYLTTPCTNVTQIRGLGSRKGVSKISKLRSKFSSSKKTQEMYHMLTQV